MAVHHKYLKIETVLAYSPVNPDPMAGAPIRYGRDCMRNMGHEDATIPPAEINARTMAALVYREYLDPTYLVPKPDKIVLADVNEPAYHRRVPGAVVYARPGDRLKIHVLNADDQPHSFHVHGLLYGIDSDGSYPLGTQAADGRRSDEICPGQSWTYTYDVTEKMVGAWPFHDHHKNIAGNINRGLFGGIIVLPEDDCDEPPRMRLPDDIVEVLNELHRSLPAGTMTEDDLEADEDGPDRGEQTREDAALPARPAQFEGLEINLEEYLNLPDVYPVPSRTEVLHVPLFLHFMTGPGGVPAFDSGPIPLNEAFETSLGAEGVFDYHCNIHPSMRGRVTVAAGQPMLTSITIDDSNPIDMKFSPSAATVGVGGTIHWSNGASNVHTVTDDAAGMPSFCFNGRSFLGNTPTILAEAGQKIRWYVFNLDLGTMWHNLHPHAQRWQFAGEPYDTRSLGPAESFVVETTAPPVLLLPPDIAKAQHAGSRHRKDARQYHVRGDFLFHCHVEMHMMSGLVGLVRSRQTLWLTPAQAKRLEMTTGLPLDHGDNDCPPVDAERCHSQDCGKWEEVAGSPAVCQMHACLLPNTQKVLFWGYGDTRDDISRIWDYSTPGGSFDAPGNQPFDVTVPPHDRPLANLWSAEHTHLDTPEGTLLIHGGFTPREAYLFDHTAASPWSRVEPTQDQRFYSTTLTLADGKALTILGGSPASVPAKSIEIYDPASGSWAAPIPLPATFDYLYYPWTYLLPGGDLFIAGPRGVTRRFNPLAPVDDPSRTWPTIAGNRSSGGEKGTSVLLPLMPPDYRPRVLIAGGDTPAPPPGLPTTLPSAQTCEIIDLSDAAPAWKPVPNLIQPRAHQVNTVLMPDGRILLAGGIPNTGGPAEILDTKNLAAGWTACAVMKYSRGYHSSAILLADGSILMGGDQDIPGGWKSGETTPSERYFPWYYSRPRPVIGTSPTTVSHGATFAIDTPSAGSIAEVLLMRPGAVTHGFNMAQRSVGCTITARGATAIHVDAPPDGNVAPPGPYLLFIVDAARVPSLAAWIRLTP